MKLISIIFIYISVTVFSGCATQNIPANYQSKVQNLEDEIVDLKSRVAELETLFTDKTVNASLPKPTDGWKTTDSWRKLASGMSYEEVESILGTPHHIEGGDIATWKYKNGGFVRFVSGSVTRWVEPN